MRNPLLVLAPVAVGALAALISTPSTRAAGTFTVTTTADSGPNSLRQAILDANAANGGTINVTTAGVVNLNSALPIISAPLAINGGGLLISGQNQYRVFFVDAPGAVTLNNLNILNGKAIGGAGGAGGGGGLGAGGGLFVGRGDVTLANVTFTANTAVGGAVPDSGNDGGGGGLGGAGGYVHGGGGGYFGFGGFGDNTRHSGGGGGGYDRNGRDPLVETGGAGGGQGGQGVPFGGGAGAALPAGGPGGGGGGGGSLASPGASTFDIHGGAGGTYGGGGGGGGSGGTSGGFGGNGGDYGGGGGSSVRGGAGGFGGGGGAGFNVGGYGGFGGGGGASMAASAFGLGGAFAANGMSGAGTSNGGGGAALGAHVFVRGGATLTVIDSAADTGILTPGPGAQASATAFFLSGPTTFSVAAGATRTISGSITDAGGFLGSASAAGFAPAIVTKTGPGTLVLPGFNFWQGQTRISQGALVATPISIGNNSLVLNDAATGAADTSLLMSPGSLALPITVANFGSGITTIGSTAESAGSITFNGALTLNRSVTLLAQNATPQNAKNEPGQTLFTGAISGPGGVTISGGHMIQFRNAAKTYTGRTTVSANSTLSLYDNASTPSNSTIQVDAGSTVVLEGLTNAILGGLSGGGTLTHNAAWASASTLEVGRNNENTAFTGRITGNISLSKMGTGTLDLGAQDNTVLRLTVSAGRVRLAGDQRMQTAFVSTADPGPQTLDLAGHAMVFEPAGTLAALGLESNLNFKIGSAADGIYDSTAPAHPGSTIGIAFTSGDGKPVRMRLTLAGDADLDGHVNFADLVTLAQNYNAPDDGYLWDEGDFNYDHNVDFGDLILLAQNYNRAFAPAAPIPGARAGFNNDLAAATAASSVPEPASALTLIIPFALARTARRIRT
jgi:hypothetical protein